MRPFSTSTRISVRAGQGAAAVTCVQLIPSLEDHTSLELEPPRTQSLPFSTTTPISSRGPQGAVLVSWVQFAPSLEDQTSEPPVAPPTSTILPLNSTTS